MNIILDVNKHFLLYRILKENGWCKNKKIKKLSQEIEEIKKHYNNNLFISPFLEDPWQLECALPLIFSGTTKKEKNFLGDINNIYDKVFKLKEFEDVYKETLEFKDKVQLEWEAKFDFIEEYVKKVLKIEIPSFKANIFLVHPDLPSGRCFTEYKTAVYGHYDD